MRVKCGCLSAFSSAFYLLQHPHICILPGIRNIRSQDYSFPGTFVPMMELSFSGPFVPWNIRSLDRSFPGTFVLKTIRSLEHSFPGPATAIFERMSFTDSPLLSVKKIK